MSDEHDEEELVCWFCNKVIADEDMGNEGVVVNRETGKDHPVFSHQLCITMAAFNADLEQGGGETIDDEA